MQVTYNTQQFTYIFMDGEVIVNQGTDKEHTRDGFYLLQQKPEVYIPELDHTEDACEEVVGWVITDDMYTAIFQYTNMDTWESKQLTEKFVTTDMLLCGLYTV